MGNCFPKGSDTLLKLVWLDSILYRGFLSRSQFACLNQFYCNAIANVIYMFEWWGDISGKYHKRISQTHWVAKWPLPVLNKNMSITPNMQPTSFDVGYFFLTRRCYHYNSQYPVSVRSCLLAHDNVCVPQDIFMNNLRNLLDWVFMVDLFHQ